MEIQRVTVKVTYTTTDWPESLSDHAKIIRALVDNHLAVTDVKCEPISMAQWQE